MQIKGRLFVIGVTIAFSFLCCKQESKSDVATGGLLPNAPPGTEAVLRKEFPGAIPGPEFGDSIINYLREKYGIEPDQILVGASTCVDDIIYTKNFHVHREIKGPFHLGGLAGFPFTGISGLEAFAHHIPESGTMVLLVEPHIGYSEKGGWGFVLRHGQLKASSCCGALMGTLGKLKAGTLSSDITESDYQGGKIAGFALLHKEEILSSETPIIELTRVASISAEQQILVQVLGVDLSHIKYIVIITGVIVNTDYMFADYHYVSSIQIYDAGTKTLVEELRNPGTPLD